MHNGCKPNSALQYEMGTDWDTGIVRRFNENMTEYTATRKLPFSKEAILLCQLDTNMIHITTSVSLLYCEFSPTQIKTCLWSKTDCWFYSISIAQWSDWDRFFFIILLENSSFVKWSQAVIRFAFKISPPIKAVIYTSKIVNVKHRWRSYHWSLGKIKKGICVYKC